MNNKFILLLCFCAMSWLKLDAQHHYKVSATNNKIVHVKGVFDLNGKTVYMPIVSSKKVPNGPVEFIKNIRVTDDKGDSVAITSTKNNSNYYSWTLEADYGQINISYDIDINHDQYDDWPFGLEEIAYTTQEGFMILGRYLFIVPNFDVKGKYNVVFDLPKSWTVSTAWAPEKDKNTYANIGAEQFRNNVIYMGEHKEEHIDIGDTTIKLVLVPALKTEKYKIIKYLEPNLKAMSALFGSAPNASYLVVMKEGPIGGGAFRESYSMSIEHPLNEASSALWGHGMIHETFHLWNGHSLIPSEQVEWFKEGATEYLSTVIQAKNGTLSRCNTERKIEAAYRRHFLAKMMAPPISLQEAGNNKGQNKMKIYGLGTLFSLILDIEIRHANNNVGGLGDVLKLMYKDIALKNKNYTLQDIITYTNRVAKKDLTYLFDNYVTGMKDINLNRYLKKGGFQISVMYEDAYFSSNPEANELEKSIRNKIFGWD